MLASALAVLSITAVAPGRADGAGFSHRDDDRDGDARVYAIGLWGDLPYSDLQATMGVPNLIADMNEQDLEFTVHDGDLKAGNGTPGSRTSLASRPSATTRETATTT